MKSRIHPKYKTKYRVGNWAEYDRALVQRGDVTIWISEGAIAAWVPVRSGRRGGQQKFSDLAIQTALVSGDPDPRDPGGLRVMPPPPSRVAKAMAV